MLRQHGRPGQDAEAFIVAFQHADLNGIKRLRPVTGAFLTGKGNADAVLQKCLDVPHLEEVFEVAVVRRGLLVVPRTKNKGLGCARPDLFCNAVCPGRMLMKSSRPGHSAVHSCSHHCKWAAVAGFAGSFQSIQGLALQLHDLRRRSVRNLPSSAFLWVYP